MLACTYSEQVRCRGLIYIIMRGDRDPAAEGGDSTERVAAAAVEGILKPDRREAATVLIAAGDIRGPFRELLGLGDADIILPEEAPPTGRGLPRGELRSEARKGSPPAGLLICAAARSWRSIARAAFPSLTSVRKLKSRDCVTMAALEWSGWNGLLNVGMSRALNTMLLFDQDQ